MRKKGIQLTNENLLIGIFVINVLVSILASFSLYRFPAMTSILMLLLVAIYMVIRSGKRMLSIRRKEAKIFGVSWGIVYVLSAITSGIIPGLGLWVSLLFGVLFLCLKENTQEKVLHAYVWTFSIFLCFSIVEYGVYQLTGQGIVIGNAYRSTGYKDTYFVQLLFNLVRTDLIIPRFQGLANEPGLLGTLCGLLLYYTRRERKLRIPYYIFLLSGVISFSLAFYVILAIHFLFVVRLNWKGILVIVLIISASFYMLRDQFEVLIERVVESEDIDNRTSENFDDAFEKAYSQGILWFGVGYQNVEGLIDKSDGGNSGGKLWILQYGIIGVIIVFIGYGMLYYYRCGRKLQLYDWLFLIVFWLSFYQRQTIYTPYTILVFLAVPLVSKQLRITAAKNE